MRSLLCANSEKHGRKIFLFLLICPVLYSLLKNPGYYLHNVITVTLHDLLAFHKKVQGQGLERLIEFSYGDNLHWHPATFKWHRNKLKMGQSKIEFLEQNLALEKKGEIYCFIKQWK